MRQSGTIVILALLAICFVAGCPCLPDSACRTCGKTCPYCGNPFENDFSALDYGDD